MNRWKLLILGVLILAAGAVIAGCTSGGPCEITAFEPLTVYRLPDPASDVFGTLPAGETHEVLAYTANGFVGFDPGIAQASNVGLARLRWVLLNASLSPFCLAEVEQVTLPDVLADMIPTPVPPTPTPIPPEPGAANLVITAVNISSPITENSYAPLDVTVQNQGDAPASGYDVVLIPHYGWGPPNPGGLETLPDLLPGASHTIVFSPGVLYGSPGAFTLRVLVTDDWYALGDPDSTGSGGDYLDHPIDVLANLCNPFEGLEPTFVLLNLPADTKNLPTYMKVSEGIFPGYEIEPPLPYIAELGTETAYQISQQGFPKRAYFMFHIPESMEGTEQPFRLWLPDCPEPVYELPAVQIPVSKHVAPVCSPDLNEKSCEAAGGTYKESRTTAGGECNCP